MAKAQAKYEKWLEKMENDDGTATDTYCIIREIHWDEEHGYVMKHDRLSLIVKKCSWYGIADEQILFAVEADA